MRDPDLSQSAASRLLLITGSLQGGGAERQLSDMANYWVAREAQVTLATWSGREVGDFYALHRDVRRVYLDVPISRRTALVRVAGVLRAILRLRRLLTTLRPDVVVSFIDVSNVCSILAASGLGVPVVVAERTHPAINRSVSRPWRVLRRLLYARADRVVAQTRDAADWLERECRTRVTVIPNALRELPQLACQRELLIVAAGRLSKEKGFDLLLRAFARVAPQFPDWRLCILGDGSERRTFVELRDRLELRERVEFLGEVSDVERWLARAGLLVHPSRREGFPNVVLEAMGMGVAVICTDCRAGPSELIEDGINGRLVPVDDIDALSHAMADLMGKPSAREALGREARKVRQQFRQERIMARWQACVLPPGRAAVGTGTRD